MDDIDFSGVIEKQNNCLINSHDNENINDDNSMLLNQINELRFLNEILESQVRYFQKQCVEKDNYIFYIKEKLNSLHKQILPNKEKENCSLSYCNYKPISVPKTAGKHFSAHIPNTNDVNCKNENNNNNDVFEKKEVLLNKLNKDTLNENEKEEKQKENNNNNLKNVKKEKGKVHLVKNKKRVKSNNKYNNVTSKTKRNYKRNIINGVTIKNKDLTIDKNVGKNIKKRNKTTFKTEKIKTQIDGLLENNFEGWTKLKRYLKSEKEYYKIQNSKKNKKNEKKLFQMNGNFALFNNN